MPVVATARRRPTSSGVCDRAQHGRTRLDGYQAHRIAGLQRLAAHPDRPTGGLLGVGSGVGTEVGHDHQRPADLALVLAHHQLAAAGTGGCGPVDPAHQVTGLVLAGAPDQVGDLAAGGFRGGVVAYRPGQAQLAGGLRRGDDVEWLGQAVTIVRVAPTKPNGAVWDTTVSRWVNRPRRGWVTVKPPWSLPWTRAQTPNPGRPTSTGADGPMTESARDADWPTATSDGVEIVTATFPVRRARATGTRRRSALRHRRSGTAATTSSPRQTRRGTRRG